MDHVLSAPRREAFLFLLAHTKENGRCGMASSISAIKLPVAAFRRRVAGCPGQGQRFAAKIQMRRQPSASRTGNDDRSPQARRHCLALSAESAIRLAERTARPEGGKPPPASQVVSKCALRDKKESGAPRFPGTPHSRYGKISRNALSSSSSSMCLAAGKCFSNTAPSWISRRVLAFRSLTRFLACASSMRCLA